MGPGRVRFQGEVEVLFDSRILFKMVLDSLQVVVDVFEVVVGGC